MTGLPAQPEEAFVHLERIARERLQEILQETRLETWDNEVDYVGTVMALARHYRIDIGQWELPHVEDENVGSVYRMFKLHISGLCTELRLRNADRARQSAITFDPATKAKLRRLLDQMREAVDKERGLTPRKRDALYSKIAALSKEVDSDWARSESLGNLAIELAEDADEAVGKLENVRRWFGDIAALLNRARRDQGQQQLPPPRERKRIEPPRTKPRGSQWDTKIDDEIPF
jgi:hypothetical protein